MYKNATLFLDVSGTCPAFHVWFPYPIIYLLCLGPCPFMHCFHLWHRLVCPVMYCVLSFMSLRLCPIMHCFLFPGSSCVVSPATRWPLPTLMTPTCWTSWALTRLCLTSSAASSWMSCKPLLTDSFLQPESTQRHCTCPDTSILQGSGYLKWIHEAKLGNFNP